MRKRCVRNSHTDNHHKQQRESNGPIVPLIAIRKGFIVATVASDIQIALPNGISSGLADHAHPPLQVRSASVKVTIRPILNCQCIRGLIVIIRDND